MLEYLPSKTLQQNGNSVVKIPCTSFCGFGRVFFSLNSWAACFKRAWQENYRDGDVPLPEHDKGGCLKPHHTAELTLTT